MLGLASLSALPSNATPSRCFGVHRAKAPPRLRHGHQRQSAPLPGHRQAAARRCRAQPSTTAASPDYYGLLGVARDASGKEIKSAFRKKALKLHPDVNKAPDAKEQFMAAKEAFQVLSDAQTRASYDRQLSGGLGGFDWGNPFGSSGSSRSNSGAAAGSSGTKRRQKAEEEPFYGVGAFFNDLEKEWKERRRRRQKEPQSLWEELADIGEEFVEFLEKEIGLPTWEAQAEARASDSGSRNEAARKAGYAAQQQQQQRADAGAAQAARNAETGAKSAAADAHARTKSAADDVEDALAELKRKMNRS